MAQPAFLSLCPYPAGGALLSAGESWGVRYSCLKGEPAGMAVLSSRPLSWLWGVGVGVQVSERAGLRCQDAAAGALVQSEQRLALMS